MLEGEFLCEIMDIPYICSRPHSVLRVNALQGFLQFGMRAWLHAVAGPDHAGFAIDREAEPAADDAGGLGVRVGMQLSHPSQSGRD